MRGLFRICALCVVLVCAGVFAAPAAAQTEPASCDVTAQNIYVRDVMTDIYYWYGEIPDVDPAAFASPADYLEAIRYRPLDETFSYVAPRAATEAFFAESQFIGFGFSSVLHGTDAMQVTDVMPGSPANDANLSRGDRIVEINGRSVEALRRAGDLDDAFGPAEEGAQASIVVVRGGSRFQARLTKRVVTIPTVSAVQVYSAGGREVGYLFFRNFVTPSYSALDAAFDQFRARAINELVVDVRYNGGGLVGVAERLASLIGGVRTDGQVFAEYFHNDKNSFLNRVTRFEARPNAIGLERVIVITTRASASASELVINALRPFITVVVVGDRTYGKPVGQYAISFCDKTLAPVAFTLRNANHEGDYFDGIPPTCPAADDLEHQIGDTQESSLREALTVVASGHCSSSAQASRKRSSEAIFARPRGWQSILNAH